MLHRSETRLSWSAVASNPTFERTATSGARSTLRWASQIALRRIRPNRHLHLLNSLAHGATHPLQSCANGLHLSTGFVIQSSLNFSITRLEADDWYQVRQKGSHRQFHHASRSGTVTVAGKPSVEIPPGTLNSIFKQAGLKK